jgi:hypothetical protein
MRWSLGLSAWVIQDGNYGDFERGQRAELAVEFYFEETPVLSGEAPGVRHLGGCTYELTGRVVLNESEVWVLDFGILAYQRLRAPRDWNVGDVVRGRATLGVDPFFYFERLGADPAMPALIYTWDVARMLRQSAPLVESEGVFERDASQLDWAEIAATDAWADDGGSAEYVLECELLAEAPKRSSKTAAAAL